MLISDKRQSIYQLHSQGHSARKISKLMRVSRTTVKRIIKEKGILPEKKESPEEERINERIEALYQKCEGRAQRVYEELTAAGFELCYSSVTRRIRLLELGKTPRRAKRVPDEPGVEMQHDTTVYFVPINGKKMKVVASLLYFRYSKKKYLKFYLNFDRFKMQCFLYEALHYFGYSARVCIIDNTNLARLRGSGGSAVIVERMIRFANQFGFTFHCHEINHPNRKAGNERAFWTVETNFLPGRTFSSLEDMNKQAHHWATVINANRKVNRTDIIPAITFEQEKGYLKPVMEGIEPPYQVHERILDQYGYVAFAGNFYWVPKINGRTVTVLEYADTLKIYEKRQLIVQYPLASPLIKNQIFKGEKTMESQKPNNYKPRKPIEEEKQLRALDPAVDDYLTWTLKQASLTQRPKLIRNLFRLSRQLEETIFVSTIKRAQTYQITDRSALENIAFMLMKDQGLPLPEVPDFFDFENRKAYQAGQISSAVDLSQYDQFETENS